MAQYIRPFWSGKPSQQYTVQILKDGIVIQEPREINQKEYYIIGRAQDKDIDFLMEHQSISRKHAVIQHKDNGQIFIYDLGSTHGTYLNKKRIPSRQYIQIRSGDCFKFGYSSRLYFLNKVSINDDDDDDEGENQDSPTPSVMNQKQSKKISIVSRADKDKAIRANRIEQINKINQQLQEKKFKFHQNPQEGATWGMDFSDLNQQNSEDDRCSQDYEQDWVRTLDFTSLKQREDLTKKNLDAISTIQKLVSQVNKMEIDIAKMTKKDEIALQSDAKSSKRLQDLQTKINAAKKKIDVMVDNLKVDLSHSKNQTVNQMSKVIQDYYNNDSDDDQFYDRTMNTALNKKLKQKSTIQSYDTLKIKLEISLKERDKIFHQLISVNKIKTKQSDLKNEEDSLDAYFMQNSKQVKKQEGQKLSNKLSQLNSQIEETKALLRIVQPSFASSNIAASKLEFESKSNIEVDKKISQIECLKEQQQDVKPSYNSLTDTLEKIKLLKKREEQIEVASPQKLVKQSSNEAGAQKVESLNTEEQIESQDIEMSDQQQLDEGQAQEPDEQQIANQQKIKQYNKTIADFDQSRQIKTAFDQIIKNKNQNSIDLSNYQLFIKEFSSKKGSTQQQPGDNSIEPQILKKKRKVRGQQQSQVPEAIEEDWVPPDVKQENEKATRLKQKLGY